MSGFKQSWVKKYLQPGDIYLGYKENTGPYKVYALAFFYLGEPEDGYILVIEYLDEYGIRKQTARYLDKFNEFEKYMNKDYPDADWSKKWTTSKGRKLDMKQIKTLLDKYLKKYKGVDLKKIKN